MADGLSGAVRWWEEWQLRVLVLSSLGVQYFMFFFSGRRKGRISPLFRFLIWLLFLGSDALAIYALATLFNRQRQHGSKDGSRDLEVFWAPILLMHLGGQIFITAYNIEDNELWTRHAATALSQITVALYVFCKTWSPAADRKLLVSAILLFIAGILNCLSKLCHLRSASFNRLADASKSVWQVTTVNRERELEAYIQHAVTLVQNPASATYNNSVPSLSADKLFIDFSYPYTVRLAKLTSFWTWSELNVYDSLRGELSDAFDRLYTKFRSVGLQILHDTALYAIMTTALVLFHKSHKKAYSAKDITVTLVLLWGTFVMEYASSNVIMCYMICFPRTFASTVSQQSIIGSLASKNRHAKLVAITRALGCKDLLNQFWYMEPCYSYDGITSWVRYYLKQGWTRYITDVESYRKFSDTRGQWALEREGCDQQLVWSLEKLFDESVLLWHIATDLCFHQLGTDSGHECARRCREISNYMMHLLVNNPEMLMTGSRRYLFTTASDEIEDILKGEEILSDEKALAEKVIGKAHSTEGFVHDAWVLAQGLMDLGDENKMWKVIHDVWVEMLCFSAGRCRGYLHAKSLPLVGSTSPLSGSCCHTQGWKHYLRCFREHTGSSRRYTVARTRQIEEKMLPPHMTQSLGEKKKMTTLSMKTLSSTKLSSHDNKRLQEPNR